MSEATDHYERLLAEHYIWMFGVSMAWKAAEQRELLTRLKVTPGELAVDLGAGPGFQSIALADLGFKRVLALDTSAKLLEELRRRQGERPIHTLETDMLRLAEHVAPGTADTIVCMGDTVTHLSAREQVTELFSEVFRALRPGGDFVLTYRDLSTELHGVDRIIPVRSTPDKIMTCFLEYRPETVVVHDLIQIRAGDSWTFLKSAYPKLRLRADELSRDLEHLGFEIDARETERGMSVLAAHRP